ncbi:unnamed protein product, partial [Musa acuminata var. zebrina]
MPGRAAETSSLNFSPADSHLTAVTCAGWVCDTDGLFLGCRFIFSVANLTSPPFVRPTNAARPSWRKRDLHRWMEWI